jgi:hypothetical protein
MCKRALTCPTGYAIENALYLKERLGQPADVDAELLAFANAAAAQG